MKRKRLRIVLMLSSFIYFMFSVTLNEETKQISTHLLDDFALLKHPSMKLIVCFITNYNYSFSIKFIISEAKF